MAVGEIGIDRFMFGTDYPYIVSDPSYIEALDLPAGNKQKIFGCNAQRLFAERLSNQGAVAHFTHDHAFRGKNETRPCILSMSAFAPWQTLPSP